MKLTKSALLVMAAAGTLWAQAPATPKTPATPNASQAQAPMKTKAAKPAPKLPPIGGATPATTAAKPATTAAKPAPTAKKAAAAKPPAKAVKKAIAQKPAAKTPFAPKPKMVAKKPAEKPAEKPATAQAAVNKPSGKRDPFVSPVIARMGGPNVGCATGKRCLVINQITLKGIAKTPHGWVAMVENPAQKAYFLYENDPLFDGFVEKITSDSVIFKENVYDSLGHQSQREVTKRVTAPVV